MNAAARGPESGSARERLVAAAKELIWEHGVEATSPNGLLAAAGVGQGSLYHHFDGKPDWAHAAIEALADDLTAETTALLDQPGVGGYDRLLAYLDKPRAALAGCRLGRLAFDPAVAASPTLQAPIHGYAAALHASLRRAIAEARDAGDLSRTVDPDTLARTIAATVQGGYVCARMNGTETAMTEAISGLLALLHTAGTARQRR